MELHQCLGWVESQSETPYGLPCLGIFIGTSSYSTLVPTAVA
jgi:hypothetical protein